jgi:hypothetical protein
MHADQPLVSVSIVSHGHAGHVRNLVGDLNAIRQTKLEILLTANAGEFAELARISSSHVLRVIANPRSKGFSENHNAAFRVARGAYFCVLNPDIRLPADPFGPLLAELQDPCTGVAAPIVVDGRAAVQQSARRVMSPAILALRALGLRRSAADAPSHVLQPDWVAGMFMLFRREVYERVGGFDERYFLYCEDMEICCRLWLSGMKVCVTGNARVVHEAQYASKRHLTYFLHHVRSLIRFWRSETYRSYRMRFPHGQPDSP